MGEKIFLSYNSRAPKEKAIANLIYKKGVKNGLQIFLPERNTMQGEINLNPLTRGRIDYCDWFILFSTEKLGRAVQQEINYAISKGHKNIIIIYSVSKGKNIKISPLVKQSIVEHYLNTNDLNDIEKVVGNIFQKTIIQNRSNVSQTNARNIAQYQLNKKKDDNEVAKVVLGIGIAALLIAALSGKGK